MIINYLNGLSDRLDKERFLPFLIFFFFIPSINLNDENELMPVLLNVDNDEEETGFVYLRVFLYLLYAIALLNAC